jgi:ankyrin repeat protein
LTEAIIFWLPQMLALCYIAFSLSLKSSIEQAVLYAAARQALGEGAAETDGPPYRQDVEARSRGLWLSFKTYAPTCALLLMMGALQVQKFPLMSVAIDAREIHTVKALQATGVPLPFQSSTGILPMGRHWLKKFFLSPFRAYRFQPYDQFTIQSRAMTKFLLEKGVDVNTRLVLDGAWMPPGIGDVSMTPLHVALRTGEVEIARMMIAHGADVHARDSIGRTPLTVAITYCPSAIELLLASGADINEQTRFGPPLFTAARYQWLYPEERRTRRRMFGENAVKILLEKGADPNTRDSDGRNALMVMSMEHRPGSMRISPLLRPVDSKVLRPIIEYSLSRNAVEVESNNALLLIGETLLQAGCDINAADINGRTPLMYAVRYQWPAAVRLLLERDANVDVRDKGGMTAMDLAKQFAGQEIIKLLHPAGVLPGAPKKPGARPVKPAE